jgi:RNA polymerase sigma-70 factor (ECF subfamily)
MRSRGREPYVREKTARRALKRESRHSAHFPTTHWSLVTAAGDRAAPEARAALAELCEVYWYPIYALIRRRGHPPDEACDLAQDYFVRLLEKGVIAAADWSKGRFRAFLRTDCQHFLMDQARKRIVPATRSKAIPIDGTGAESRYRLEPVDDMTAERLFDRTWAATLLDRAIGLLREEYAAKGRTDIFDRLKVVLSQDKGAVKAADLAAQLGTTKGAVRTAVHRLKKRYREILLREIAATLDDPAEVTEEIRWLFEALRS